MVRGESVASRKLAKATLAVCIATIPGLILPKKKLPMNTSICKRAGACVCVCACVRARINAKGNVLIRKMVFVSTGKTVKGNLQQMRVAPAEVPHPTTARGKGGQSKVVRVKEIQE
eukprot:3550771-Amphidinium_carterae.1